LYTDLDRITFVWKYVEGISFDWAINFQFLHCILTCFLFSKLRKYLLLLSPSIERSLYLSKIRIICTFFLFYWTQCIDGCSLSLQRYVRKGNNANNPAILNFSWLPKVKCSTCAVAQKIKRLIAFAETCRFLTIQSLEFQEIWQNSSSKTMWMISCKKFEFLHREFLTI